MTLCKCWAHEKMGDLQNGVMGQNRLSNSALEVLLMYHLRYRMTSACQSGDATSPNSYSPCRHLETCWDAVKGECEISPSRWLCPTACGVKWLCQQFNYSGSKHRQDQDVLESNCETNAHTVCVNLFYTTNSLKIMFWIVVLMRFLVVNCQQKTESKL